MRFVERHRSRYETEQGLVSHAQTRLLDKKALLYVHNTVYPPCFTIDRVLRSSFSTSKAFDIVNTRLLLAKLEALSVSPILCK